MTAREALAAAAISEIAYVLIRSAIRSGPWPAATAELAVTVFRFVSIGVLILLARKIARGERASTRVGWAIYAAIVIDFMFMPPVDPTYHPDSRSLAIFILTTPILALREELFYRRILITSLEGLVSPGAALAISTLAFVLYHIGSQPMTSVNICMIASMGIVLGILWQAKRALLPLVAYHTVYDVFAAIPQYGLVNEIWSILGNLTAVAIVLMWARKTSSRTRVESDVT